MAKGKKTLFSTVTVVFTLFLIVGILLFFNKNKTSADANIKGSLNNESKIKVSVIIPVYKAEKYLPKCLDSVLNQTLKDIEVICVNDKSPDNCGKILEDYEKKDKRIIVINHKENKGASAARNTGLNVARGEYIRFSDDDDTMESNACEISYKKAKAESADILYDGMSDEKVLTGPIYYDVHWSVWSGVYRRDFLNKNNLKFYEPIRQYGEDRLFNMLCIPKAKKIVCIKNRLYNYRCNTDGFSKDVKFRKEFPKKHSTAVRIVREAWSKDSYFSSNTAKVSFLKWAYSMNIWKTKDANNMFVEAIGGDLLKDEVLNLLDKNTRDSIKNMIKNSKA